MMLSLAVFVLLIENICLLLGIIFRAKAFIRKYLLADNPGKTPNIFYTDTDTGKGCLLMSRDPADQASASVKSLVSFHRQWRGAPLTLNGLPLSDDKEGHCFSVLVVDSNRESRAMMEKFFLSKNTAVTMTDSADHAIGMLHNYKYNIIILDVDILSGASLDKFRVLAALNSLLFVGIVSTGTYSDSYTLFDMQVLRPLNESSIDIILKVEQITADKLIICQQRNHVVVPGEISGIDKIISNANAHPAKILTDGKFFGTGVVEENDRTGRKSSIEMTSSQNIGTIANNMLKETECLHHNKIKSSIFEKMFSNVIICITKDQEAITH